MSTEEQQFEDAIESIFKKYSPDGDQITKENAIKFVKEVFDTYMVPLSASQKGTLISNVEKADFEVITKVKLQDMMLEILGIKPE